MSMMYPTFKSVGRFKGIGSSFTGVGQSASIPAFPSAEGFGAKSIGGRGGRVIEVTNLNNGGSGSFRDAIEASGPRMVVFRVGGTIELTSRITLQNPFITIAGQTAPGGGITLKNHPSSRGIPLVITTNDVIVRHLRVRSGPPNVKTCCSDTIRIERNASNIILDHVSLSWGVDGVLDIGRSHNITVQWSTISEALNCSAHKSGCHSTGGHTTNGAYNVSFHHNIIAHNSERNFKLRGENEFLEGNDAIYDFVNNVVYDWNAYATAVAGSGKANIVGNYFKLGPSTSTYPGRREIITMQWQEGRSVYAIGNIGPTCPNGCPDSGNPSEEWDWDANMISTLGGKLKTKTDDAQFTPTRHNAPQVNTHSAQKAYDLVLENAGATIPLRDAVDQRVSNEVRTGTGRIINDPSNVGGWPVLAPGTPPVDSDRDGIPDAWAALNLPVGFLAHDISPSGYSYLEEYVNGLVVDVVPIPVPTPTPPPPMPIPEPIPEPVPTPSPTPVPPPPGEVPNGVPTPPTPDEDVRTGVGVAAVALAGLALLIGLGRNK